MRHALATSLRGFRSSSLRVLVLEARDGCVWVQTADLLDVGTKLVLDASQVQELPEELEALRHKNGLVAFA